MYRLRGAICPCAYLAPHGRPSLLPGLLVASGAVVLTGGLRLTQRPTRYRKYGILKAYSIYYLGTERICTSCSTLASIRTIPKPRNSTRRFLTRRPLIRRLGGISQKCHLRYFIYTLSILLQYPLYPQNMRVLSNANKLTTLERSCLAPDIIEASECLKNWWDRGLI